MKIDWTEATLEAVSEIINDGLDDDLSLGKADVIRALDAAVAAQGCALLEPGDEALHAKSYEKGRAEALEEAAKVADARSRDPDLAIQTEIMCRKIAATIRALKETQG